MPKAIKGIHKPKAVRIDRGVYAMEMTDGENATLEMYGEIVESQPVDFWTGAPVEGSFIVQDEFLEDLKAVAEAKAAASASGGQSLVPQAGEDAVSAAVQAEQKRIQEIDAVASLYDAETVKAAKYGEHACTAQEMTYRAARQAAAKGKQFLGDLEDDAKASGAAGVGAAPPPPDKGGEDPVAQARADAKAFNERKKEVR